jgi:hypothetical protein
MMMLLDRIRIQIIQTPSFNCFFFWSKILLGQRVQILRYFLSEKKEVQQLADAVEWE